MIRNERVFHEWEDGWMAQNPLSLEKKFRLLDGMYHEAIALGVFPSQNLLDGLEFKIKLARDLNGGGIPNGNKKSNQRI